jgi:hypothetical protein
MYSGLYTGLRGRVSTEYAKCPAKGFHCLSLVTIGRYAAAVLASLYKSMASPSYLKPRDLKKNFALSGVELPGEAVCGICDVGACEPAIFSFLQDNRLEVDKDSVAQLIALNCVCP